MTFTVFLTLVLLVAFILLLRNRVNRNSSPEIFDVPEKWKVILSDQILFYQNLDVEGKQRFESDVYQFLDSVAISGVQTKVTLEDRLLVASSAVIPLFGFPAWTYTHLDEVILYPSSFDRNFNLGSKDGLY